MYGVQSKEKDDIFVFTILTLFNFFKLAEELILEEKTATISFQAIHKKKQKNQIKVNQLILVVSFTES